MNEPMMSVERDRDGTTSRRFATPDETGAAPFAIPTRAPAPSPRWFGAGRRARPDLPAGA